MLELLLSGPVTGKNVPLLPEQYCVIPSSVFPVLLRQNPWEGNSKEILVCKNTEQELLQASIFETNLFVMMDFSLY